MEKMTIILLFLLTQGCVTVYNPATHKKEFYFIDQNSEILWGRYLASEILRTKKAVKDGGLNKYINDIGKMIAKASDRRDLEYHFYILKDKELNAFALPGGYVFINSGLLEKVNEDELAFTLGHEIGHICARHALKRLQASLGMELILGVALREPKYADIRKGLDIIYNLISLGYSRQDELLADSLGIKYSYRAGFNPYAGITLLKKLKKEGAKHPFVFLSSHPSPDVRIKNIEKIIQELNNPHTSSKNSA